MADLISRRESLRQRIEPYTNPDEPLTADQQTELKGLLEELRGMDLQIAAQEYGVDDEVDAGPTDEMKSVDDRLTALAERLDNLKMSDNPGYIAADSGTSDPHIKTFGDFVVSIYRAGKGDRLAKKRLNEVYKTHKDLSAEQGTAGGYLIPEGFEAQLRDLGAPMQVVRPFATVIPVDTSSGSFPAIDIGALPDTADVGESAFAAGVTVDETGENTALTETNAEFNEINWRVHKIGGFTDVPSELIDDSPISIDALLRQLFARAITAKEDHYFTRGNGAGQPLGYASANNAAAVSGGSDDGSLTWADALNMFGKFQSVGGRPLWTMHNTQLEDIGQFETGTTGAPIPIDNPGALSFTNMSILGAPVLKNMYQPAKASAYSTMLVDLSAYYIWERRGLRIEFSEHAKFESDQVVWRFTERLDGQPWLRTSITLPDNSSTVSPFVYLTD